MDSLDSKVPLKARSIACEHDLVPCGLAMPSLTRGVNAPRGLEQCFLHESHCTGLTGGSYGLVPSTLFVSHECAAIWAGALQGLARGFIHRAQ